MVQKLNLVVYNENKVEDLEESTISSLEFFNGWYVSVPTTCSNHILVDCNLDDLDLEVIQLCVGS